MPLAAEAAALGLYEWRHALPCAASDTGTLVDSHSCCRATPHPLPSATSMQALRFCRTILDCDGRAPRHAMRAGRKSSSISNHRARLQIIRRAL
jgi:hypothetical protein